MVLAISRHDRDGDPWMVLGLSPGASREEIRQAYRRLVRLCHPDITRPSLHGIDTFLRIRAAYEQLIQGLTNITPGHTKTTNKPDRNEIEDGAFFFLNVTAEEAFRGAAKKITIADREAICPECSGSGRAYADPAATRNGICICADCNGTGRRALVWGTENLFVVCATCSGTGYVGQPPCRLCRGKGCIVITRDITVRLPKGVRNGEVLRLQGQGPWRADKNARDPAFVEIRVEFPEGWRLDGLDIYTRLDIDIWTALMGGKVSVAAIDSTLLIDIPPGLAQGEIITVADKGWTNETGERGRLFLAANLILPKGKPPNEAMALINLLKNLWPTDNARRQALPST
ncbi:MAG: DnaJ C-terminal domain-containing protein [Dissulfurimicrobium hydrothermale]|uniref:DnaJ C-terminal domain-containing protein n=1 Tax=Dissulfurimicrobium hydrothermale TaxID=1750598 RepID=UPI003C76A81A